LKIDNLADELVFGNDVLDWIDENYVEETRIGGVRILALQSAGKNAPIP